MEAKYYIVSTQRQNSPRTDIVARFISSNSNETLIFQSIISSVWEEANKKQIKYELSIKMELFQIVFTIEKTGWKIIPMLALFCLCQIKYTNWAVVQDYIPALNLTIHNTVGYSLWVEWMPLFI